MNHESRLAAERRSANRKPVCPYGAPLPRGRVDCGCPRCRLDLDLPVSGDEYHRIAYRINQELATDSSPATLGLFTNAELASLKSRCRS